MNIEKVILKNLFKNEEYTRKSLPFLFEEYFSSGETKALFQILRDFIVKYNARPTYDALVIEVNDKKNLGEAVHKDALNVLDEIRNDETETSQDWLLESTEKFCKERAVYNALMKSIDVMNDQVKGAEMGTILKLLEDALAVSFDTDVGHDYMENYNERYDYYHSVHEKIPFDLEFFNKITKGGVSRKTLNVILAGTGVGKSLTMCHLSAAALAQGKNVLYITLELSEKEVAKRIDANLMNITFDDLLKLPKELYDKRINSIRQKNVGKLIVKEYPTASASVNHFRALLNELNLKKSFKPDIIFIDYLNICASSRLKMNSNVNSYTLIKSIAEELRWLAVEYDLPLWTATQVNRAGFGSSDPGLENTSESFGLPATADFMFALISTEDLDALGQIMVKQLKNRYNDPSFHKRFVIGIDRSKMKLFDVEASAQVNVDDTGTSEVPAEPTFREKKSKFTKLKV